MRRFVGLFIVIVVGVALAWLARSRNVQPVTLAQPVVTQLLPENQQSGLIPPDWYPLMIKIDPAFVPDSGTADEGKRLAVAACSACHVLTPPEILPKAAWIDVFAQLLQSFQRSKVVSFDAGKVVGCADYEVGGLAPLTPAMETVRIPNADLAKIVFYYLSVAPDKSPPQLNKKPMSKAPAPFRVAFAKKYVRNFPTFLFVSIVEAESRIVLGNAFSNDLMVLDGDGQPSHNVSMPGISMAITRFGHDYYATLYGAEVNPTPATDGAIVKVSPDAIRGAANSTHEAVLSNLRKPQSIAFSDFDGDGVQDLLVKETGFIGGELAWYKMQSGKAVDKHVIFEGSGTLSAEIADLNHDKRPDIVALVGRTTQSAYLYLNQGDGTFEQSTIAQQVPGFGYQQALLADMNGDRRADLITLNGDSFDLQSYPMRNYHGVRVLANDDRGKFTERFVYPMYGARQAVARDFDGDGDTDIVAIAFGADFRARPAELIVYLENKGNWSFEPHRIQEAEQGRWMAMDSADLDHDGDDDLVLAAAYPEMLEDQTKRYFHDSDRVGYMILENTSPKNH